MLRQAVKETTCCVAAANLLLWDANNEPPLSDFPIILDHYKKRGKRVYFLEVK